MCDANGERALGWLLAPPPDAAVRSFGKEDPMKLAFAALALLLGGCALTTAPPPQAPDAVVIVLPVIRVDVLPVPRP
jgi:hypothetical protein